jgi:hypothetical protein
VTARRLLLAALLVPVGRAHAQPTRIWTIGTARMAEDGTITMDLVARDANAQGDGRYVYPPDHPDYAMILRHLGGLRPGQTKPVPPFP